jgi:hypothetical protein
MKNVVNAMVGVKDLVRDEVAEATATADIAPAARAAKRAPSSVRLLTGRRVNETNDRQSG